MSRVGERVQPLYGAYADRPATVIAIDGSGHLKLEFDEVPPLPDGTGTWPNRVWFGWQEVIAAQEAHDES